MQFWGSVSFTSLKDSVNFKSENKEYRNWKMIGLLFVKDSDHIADKYLKPLFGYFNARSTNNTDFYWAGWLSLFDDSMTSTTDRRRLAWDDEVFNSIRNDVSNNTKWKYSGGADLILFRASNATGEVHFDLGAAMCINLRALLAAGVEPDVFFEQIFEFVDAYAGETPVADFFLSSAGRSVSGSIWGIVKDLLPKGTGQELERIRHTVVKDISQSGPRQLKNLGKESWTKTYD